MKAPFYDSPSARKQKITWGMYCVNLARRTADRMLLNSYSALTIFLPFFFF